MEESIKKIVPLETDELQFIRKKFRKERSSFQRGVLTLAVLGLTTPTLLLYLFQSLRHQMYLSSEELIEEAFPDYYYFVTPGAVLFLLLIGSYYSYQSTLRKMALDTKQKEKVIERTTILRKVFMPQTRTCHFYLNSKAQLSIEVTPKDYTLYQEGDEINIEYSRNSKEYFGYF